MQCGSTRNLFEGLRDKARGCLMGLAVSDALGQPYEKLTAAQIIAGLNDPAGVMGFVVDDSRCTSELQARLRKYPRGSVTDDTQLASTVAASLIYKNGFDRAHQVHAFVYAFQDNGPENRYYWGKSSLTAGADFSLGHRDPLSDVAPPTKPGTGCGNGVAMKVAPLALYNTFIYSINEPAAIERVRSLGLMTHGDPRAWIAALGVAKVIEAAFLGRTQTPNDLLRLQGYLCYLFQRLEEHEAANIPDADRLTWRLLTAMAASNDAATLREQAGNSCYVLESVPFSIATFMRHPNDYRAAVLEAINAGGDTDSNAAMVGAMVGAAVGKTGIPAEWIAAVPVANQIRQQADELFDQFYLGFKPIP